MTSAPSIQTSASSTFSTSTSAHRVMAMARRFDEGKFRSVVSGRGSRANCSEQSLPLAVRHGKVNGGRLASYLSLRRRINSAAPNPARPVASNARLKGSGTGRKLAFACTGNSIPITNRARIRALCSTNFIMHPPRRTCDQRLSLFSISSTNNLGCTDAC